MNKTILSVDSPSNVINEPIYRVWIEAQSITAMAAWKDRQTGRE